MLINKDKNDIYYIDRKVEWEKIEQLFWHLIYTPLSPLFISHELNSMSSANPSQQVPFIQSLYLLIYMYIVLELKKKNLMFSNREMNKHWFQNWLLNTFLYPKLMRAMVDIYKADLLMCYFSILTGERLCNQR